MHLQRWMTQLPEAEEMDPPEPDMEVKPDSPRLSHEEQSKIHVVNLSK